MDQEGLEQNLIIKIFDEMSYRKEKNTCDSQNCDAPETKEITGNEASNEIYEFYEITEEPKSFDDAVEDAVKGYIKLMSLNILKRANLLHKICKKLRKFSENLSKSKSEILTLVNHFDFYSDLIIQTEGYKKWKSQELVLIILSSSVYSPSFVLGATVPAALAAGCSVIVLAPKRAQVICFLLADIIARNGACDCFFNVVTDFDENNIPESNKIGKVFFCGSYLSAQKLYATSLADSFYFFCPNNTAALILESADIIAAADKIVYETWGKTSLFAVSTIVVQESVEETFLKKLEYRMKQFMIERKNYSKFKDKIIAEKIQTIISEALQAGASVIRSSEYGNEWSPTAIVNFQNQDIDEDIPVLKVLICRTAKEGIAILNNCRYNLGTSIWSEISSQALEISSQLICPNIWINCHGVFDAGVPLQPSGFSGNCILGGNDGILENISFSSEDMLKENASSEISDCNIDKKKVLQTAVLAQQAFSAWKQNTNRRDYLKEVARLLKSNEGLSKFYEIVSCNAHFGNLINFTERNYTNEFLILKTKVPVGVILLLVNTSCIDIGLLASLISIAIVKGNSVILVLKKEDIFVESLIDNFNDILPKNILNIFIGITAGIHLASDPNIQAIWLYNESTTTSKFLQTIRSHSAKSLKHIWIVPKIQSIPHILIQKECLKNKVVWQTQIDQFP